jgi:uncharacterized membrane protein
LRLDRRLASVAELRGFSIPRRISHGALVTSSSDHSTGASYVPSSSSSALASMRSVREMLQQLVWEQSFRRLDGYIG